MHLMVNKVVYSKHRKTLTKNKESELN